MLTQSTTLRDQLFENTRLFRAGIESTGLTVLPGEHPIVPIMLGEAAFGCSHGRRAAGTGSLRYRLFLPVVPLGKARIAHKSPLGIRPMT
jgi:glycine C-acetyltransferase